MKTAGLEVELTSDFTKHVRPKRLSPFIDHIKSPTFCQIGKTFARMLFDHSNSQCKFSKLQVSFVGKLLTATTFQ